MDGRAHAFFNCCASKDEIEALLPDVRDAVQTPSELELTLTEGPEAFIRQHRTQSWRDSALEDLAREAVIAGLRYVLEARYPERSNLETADELAAVLNQTHQSPLYSADEPFEGEIVYYDGTDYVLLE